MDGNLLYMILTCIYRKILKDVVFNFSMMLDLERDSEWWVKVEFCFFGWGCCLRNRQIEQLMASRKVSLFPLHSGEEGVLMTVPAFNVCFVGIHFHAKEMPRALQARYICAYIYICIFAHYISVQHGVFFDLQPLPSWPSFAVGTNCNCWNEDPHIRQLDCHILESDGIIQATPPEISHGYLE